MPYIGDFLEDATVIEFITSHSKTGGAINPSSGLEPADLDWYRDGSAIAPIGITMSSPFVSTGLHKVTIDTSNDGGDAWITGADYHAILTPDETVDGETVIRVVIHFSIENRFNEVDLTHIMGAILAEGGAGRLAAAFNKLFDVVTPTGTINSIPDATAGAVGGLSIVGSEMNLVDAPNATAITAFRTEMEKATTILYKLKRRLINQIEIIEVSGNTVIKEDNDVTNWAVVAGAFTRAAGISIALRLEP